MAKDALSLVAGNEPHVIVACAGVAIVLTVS